MYVDVIVYVVFGSRQVCSRFCIGQYIGYLFQVFVFVYVYVGVFVDVWVICFFDQCGDDCLFLMFYVCGVELVDELVCVFGVVMVDDQVGQVVGFVYDEVYGVGVVYLCVVVCYGGGNVVFEECVVDGLGFIKVLCVCVNL